MKPLFSLVHATARPLGWQAVYAQYCRAAKNPECFEYILCFDEAQRSEFEKTVNPEWLSGTNKRAVLASSGPRALVHRGDRNYVSAANWATKYATAPIILEVTDDMMPCFHYDQHLCDVLNAEVKATSKEAFLEAIAQRELVVWVNDGVFSDISTMQILTRKYFDRYGYVFHPDFTSMEGDRSFTVRAWEDGVMLDCRENPNLQWNHQHHRNGQRQLDSSDQINQGHERYLQGWRALRKHHPNHFRMDPIDALFLAASNRQHDISEHMETLKKLANQACPCCYGEGYAEVDAMEGPQGQLCATCDGAGHIPKSILELGTRTGNSTIAFLAGRPKRLVSVDLDFSRLDPQVPAAAEYSEIPYAMMPQDSRKVLCCPECGCIPRGPCQTCDGTGCWKFDVVFFDTLHTYDQLKAEIEAHAPNCTERLLFHDSVTNRDTGEDGSTPGIWAAIQELLDGGDWKLEWHRENCNGLTLLKRVR